MMIQCEGVGGCGRGEGGASEGRLAEQSGGGVQRAAFEKAQRGADRSMAVS